MSAGRPQAATALGERANLRSAVAKPLRREYGLSVAVSCGAPRTSPNGPRPKLRETTCAKGLDPWHPTVSGVPTHILPRAGAGGDVESGCHACNIFQLFPASKRLLEKHVPRQHGSTTSNATSLMGLHTLKSVDKVLQEDFDHP